MSRIQDDPKDVLAFLNSLGFVGITAPQLKLFMKDLKLYRKIKQKEQKEWKDRTKEKLRNKQYQSLDKVLQHCRTHSHASELMSSESTTTTTTTTTSRETSSIQIHFQYSSKNKENKCSQYSSSEEESTECSSNCYYEVKRKTPVSSAKTNAKSRNVLEELSKLSVGQNNQTEIKQKRQLSQKELNNEKTNKENPPASTQRTSRSQTRSATDSTRTQRTQRSSSRSKSFIRPWKLQQESQHLVNKKSDPVALYQKYQQEWNKLSLPGEERHAKVRWEIREKMLGSDPVPKPILRKSASSATLRKHHL